jgi:ATP-dependent exoDNAse (exonuclease V) beta subunit
MSDDDHADAPWWSILPPNQSQSPPARIVGALVHEALSAWKFPRSQEDRAFRAWLASRARQLSPYETGDESPSVSQVTNLLMRLKEHSLFHKLQNAQMRFHELPFIEKVQESRGVGRIDILFSDGSDWTIVDFKTERISSESVLEDRLQRVYKPQLARYARAVQRSMGVTPRSLVCLLDYRGRVHVAVGDPMNG